MNYYSKTIYSIHNLYHVVSTIQLHQQTMESQPSTSTTTSTTSEQDNMPSSQSASVDKTPTSSNSDPTLSIPNPAYSPTSNPTEGSTSHSECIRINGKTTVNKTSSSMMKNEVKQSLPNQAKTLFAPVSIAEGLANVQLILCEEIRLKSKQ